jgi:hypothetical protein
MGKTAKRPRHSRTITVDFHDEATYVQLLDDGKAFVELVLAFILALGCQLRHKATCRGSGCLTRHSHYVRVRLSGSPFGISSAPRVVRGVGQKTPYWPVKALSWRQHAQSWRLMPARSTTAA